jgi:hypothetical protein
MLPGPNLIYECYRCEDNIKVDTIGSGNTFGARFWSDGKREAPMLPDQPWLIKCPHCRALIWMDELKYVGEVNPWDFNTSEETSLLLSWYLDLSDTPKPKVAFYVETPSFVDYYLLDMTEISDKQKERYVRLRTWWAGNDSRRGSEDSPLSDFEAENLRSLIALLNKYNVDDRIMKAEAFRELGEFSKAEKLLAPKFWNTMTKAASIIRDLNKKKITKVTEMIFE